MGCDIHVTVGWVKKDLPLLAAPTVKVKHKTESTELMIRGTKIQLGDLTLDRMCGDDEPNRFYSLFSWLAGVRGHVRPFCGSDQANQDYRTKTYELLERLAKHQGTRFWEYLNEISSGDHSFMFYTTSELIFYDYDKVYEVDPRYWQGDDSNTFDEAFIATLTRGPDSEIYLPNPEGETFKDLFGWEVRDIQGTWFYFLDVLKRDNVDFVIFGFDS